MESISESVAPTQLPQQENISPLGEGATMPTEEIAN